MAKRGSNVGPSDDTAARHGGDEFAVILPEADLEGAHNLAWRVSRRFARDLGQPPITFNFGVASYPENGSNFSEVLGDGDRFLYDMKGAHTNASKGRNENQG